MDHKVHNIPYRADSRLVPSQWETSLQCNTVSHWLCANLESALSLYTQTWMTSKTVRPQSVTGFALMQKLTIFTPINTLRPRQNGRHFADDIFKCIFLNKNVWIPIKISMKFVPKGPINSIPALVQIMAWRRPGDKPLSESMIVSLTMHNCVTRPQWVIHAEPCFLKAVRSQDPVY